MAEIVETTVDLHIWASKVSGSSLGKVNNAFKKTIGSKLRSK